MKITSIQTSNFIGARAVNVKLTKPVALFAGHNGAGKSSLQEAVRMALTGEFVRVGLKKEFGQLVTEGQGSGFAEVEINGTTRTFVTLPDGKTTPLTDYVPPAALPYVLDAQRFAKMDTNERRAFLFGLMGLSAGGAEVKKRLIAKGCNETKVEAVMPLLRAGFDTACKESQAKARDSKSQWKAVTGGETYGSNKAASFRFEKQEVDDGNITQAKTDLSAIENEIEAETSRFGELQGRARQASEQSAKLSGIRQQAGMYARINDKLNHDEAELKQWEAKIEETREQAGMKPAQNTAPHPCPHCGGNILIQHGKLEAWHEETLPHYDEEAAAKLPEYESSLRVLQNAVANGKRDLAASDAAARTLKELEDGAVLDAPAEDEITALRSRIDALKHSRTNQQSAIRLLEDAKRQANEADEKTHRAAALHHDVQQWDAITEALAPDGIPGEMLAEALNPLNERLAYSANEAQWTRINVGKDMSIYAAEESAQPRDYALLSESEKWRADAMIAEAVSHLSSLKLLVLDRFDVLDMTGRSDLIAWLEALAHDNEIDTALIFGTLKALPAQLPDCVEAYWMERGVTGQLKEVA